MKKNRCIYIFGEKVVLIPYKEEHVPKYHQWMQSTELQELTASEPLTLAEEYIMQQTWQEDEDKCTFIVLDAAKYRETNDEIASMVGDVNLFFNDFDDLYKSEAEVMIAEPDSRGKGLGKEALLFMLRYGVEDLDVKTFYAKISLKNDTSLHLFTKAGFAKVSESEVFDEVALELHVAESWYQWLVQNTHQYTRTEREDTSSEGITAL